MSTDRARTRPASRRSWPARVVRRRGGRRRGGGRRCRAGRRGGRFAGRGRGDWWFAGGGGVVVGAARGVHHDRDDRHGDQAANDAGGHRSIMSSRPHRGSSRHERAVESRWTTVGHDDPSVVDELDEVRQHAPSGGLVEPLVDVGVQRSTIDPIVLQIVAHRVEHLALALEPMGDERRTYSPGRRCGGPWVGMSTSSCRPATLRSDSM